ncbi:MAG: hypothetical protein K0B06_10490 [Brevefilum sp.]|nr:hypothetical protein [Brevefilum sp.]
MRKFLLVILMLVLAGLACNLPYQPREADVPEASDPVDGFRIESRILGEDLIKIAVPNSYYVGDAGPDLDALLGSLDLPSVPLSLELQGLLENTQDDVLLWGYDAGSTAAVPTSFVVLKNDRFAVVPLGAISTFAGSLLGNNVTIIEEQRLTIGGRDTLRWITVTREAGIEFTQAVYLFKASGTLYMIGFNANQGEVYAQLGVYDTIVASLTVEDLN